MVKESSFDVVDVEDLNLLSGRWLRNICWAVDERGWAGISLGFGQVG